MTIGEQEREPRIRKLHLACAANLELARHRLEGAHAVRHSHSIVEGGFDEMSRATRFTPGISLMIRLEIVSSRSYGRRAQSAVIASSLVTARMTIGEAYVRPSPCTPTERIAGRTANDCH